MRAFTFALAAAIATAAVPVAAAPLLIDGVGPTSEGDCTFACVIRYQQVYDNALFGAAPVLISGIDFKTNADSSGVWQTSEYQLSIGIANGGVNNLSTTFDDNLLSPVVFGNTIFSGAQAAGSFFGFDGSFVYDPALGDLIIDIVRVSGDASGVSVQFNLFGSGGEFSRVYDFESATTGYANDNYGNTTLFELEAADVPEPAMLGLFGLGAIGLGLSRRRRA